MCASLETALVNNLPPGLEEALLLARQTPAANCAVMVRWELQSEELIILELPIRPIDPARFRTR